MTNPFRLACFQVVLIFIGENLLNATSIALLRTDNEIVIAADSRSTDANDFRSADFCKIRSGRGIYFTIVGLASWPGQEGFQDIAKNYLSSEATLQNRINSLLQDMTPRLNRILKSDASARRIAIREGSVMDIVIYGMSDGKLVVNSISFKVSEDGMSVHPIAYACPGNCLNDPRFPIVAPSGVIDPELPPVDAVRRFVQAQIDRNTPGIGGPIQVLRIDRQGTSHWIEKPDVCKNEN